MGNRSLRKQLADLIKARGFHKLYYGNKRVAFKNLSAGTMRDMIRVLSFERGTLFNDCDGFNHYVVKHVGSYQRTSYNISLNTDSHRNPARVFDVYQVEKEDGSWSCGCPGSPTEPMTKEQIEACFREFYSPENVEHFKEGGWWSAKDDEKLRRLAVGEPICTDDGLPL